RVADRAAQRDVAGRPAAALRRRPRLRRHRIGARLFRGRGPPAGLDRRSHPPGELRMTPLPESLLESVAAAAVRDGLADALYTRLSTPIGRLLVVSGPDGIVRIAFESEAEDAALAEVAAALGPNVIGSNAELSAARDALSAYFEEG